MPILLSYIDAHPHAALAIIFLVAFLESVAFIGTAIPAGIVMFASGALIGAGLLDLWMTLGIAALGAIAGDGLSYELGRHYSGRVRRWRFFQRYAAAFGRGERFVLRYGGKSILFARFVAPIRAVVPVVAGVVKMPRIRFYLINIVSALGWAPAHILPGALFGASIRLAEAVTARLALMLLLATLLSWLAVRAVRLVIDSVLPFIIGWRDRVLRWATGRATPAARLVRLLFDPEQPESAALLLLALLLLASGWLFLGIVEDVVSHDVLVQADLAVFHFFQSLHTSAVDRVMLVITDLGGVAVLLPLVLLVTLWLLWRRCWHSAIYWIVAVLFSQGLIALLKVMLGRQRPLNPYPGNDIQQFSFPSGHATSSIVIYGFLAFLLVRRQSPPVRAGIVAGSAIGVALIGLSRLYLGAHWLSDVLGGFSLGLAWIALLAMLYTHYRVNDDLQPKKLGGIVAAALLLYVPWHAASHWSADLARYAIRPPAVTFSMHEWIGGGWQRLPPRRTEIVDLKEQFSLQWAADAASLSHSLRDSGWTAAPAWNLRDTLLWLTPGTDLLDLPVLPKFDQGSGSDLAFIRTDPGQPVSRIVLRLWRSPFLLRGSGPKQAEPIWYGALYREAYRRPLGFVTIYKTSEILPATDLLLPLEMRHVMVPATSDRPQRTLLLWQQ